MTASGHIDAFLKSAGWSKPERHALAGDLSSRRYSRLQNNSGTSAILMEDDDLDNLGAFILVTRWLREQGLSAPKILGANEAAGLLLLEDFGDDKLSSIVARDPKRQQELFLTAVDVLVHLKSLQPPALAKPSAKDLVDATRLLENWYPGADTKKLEIVRQRLERELTELLDTSGTVSLRDFHSDNAIWLPERTGVCRLGLLDYQDAFITHSAYDLMSLITDARMDIPSSVHAAALVRWADQTGDDVTDLEHAVAVLGLQRNLRILAVFHRAARRDGKTAHLRCVPRVRTYIHRCLRHPVFRDIENLTIDALPPSQGALT